MEESIAFLKGNYNLIYETFDKCLYLSRCLTQLIKARINMDSFDGNI